MQGHVECSCLWFTTVLTERSLPQQPAYVSSMRPRILGMQVGYSAGYFAWLQLPGADKFPNVMCVDVHASVCRKHVHTYRRLPIDTGV
jgi:hypothetical protein